MVQVNRVMQSPATAAAAAKLHAWARSTVQLVMLSTGRLVDATEADEIANRVMREADQARRGNCTSRQFIEGLVRWAMEQFAYPEIQYPVLLAMDEDELRLDWSEPRNGLDTFDEAPISTAKETPAQCQDAAL